MRKKLISTLSALLMAVGLMAQPIAGYLVETSTPGYEEITGGTIVPITAAADNIGNVVFTNGGTANTSAFTTQGYDLGFDFKYNNSLMNQVAIAARGYIVVGKDQVEGTATTNWFQIFKAAGNDNTLGMIYRSDIALDDDTEVSFKTIGSAPNRQFVVQWKGLKLQVDSWSGLEVKAKVDYQIRLNENGDVDFFFNNFKPNDGVSMNYNDMFKIGLRGTGSDYIVKSSAFEGDNTTYGSDNSINWRADAYPADGLKMHWIAPEDCAAPAKQPTGLTLSASSQSISGSFVAEPTADHYLVLISTSKDLTAFPLNGFYYNAGDEFPNANVVAYTTSTNFTTPANLEGSTEYWIHVFAVNSYCMNGPKYQYESHPYASVTTAPSSPQALQITSCELNSMTLSAAANAKGNDIIIAQTTQPLYNTYGQMLVGGTFGEPQGELNVGDELEGGGTVVYKGAASESITIADLTENELYHFKAWSVDAANNYSSTSVTADGITAGSLTWYDNLEKHSPYDAPAGWHNSDDWSCRQEYEQNVLQSNNFAGDPVSGSETWVETPDIVLSEGTNRLVFNLNMYNWARFGSTSHIFGDDNIKVQLTTDGENYTTVYTINSENQMQQSAYDEYKKYFIAFDEAAGQKVRIRLLFNIYATATLTLKDMRVEQKGDCDYPVNLRTVAEDTYGGQAMIDWTCQGEEDAWELRYKKHDDTDWNAPITTQQHPMLITGLDGLTMYDVQVRARCSATNMSDWSETMTFQSGLSVPFDMIFSEQTSEPAGWQYLQGALGTELTEADYNAGWEFRSSYWSGNYVQYSSYGEEANDWYVTPLVDLGDGSYNHKVSFSLYGYGKGSCENEKLQIVLLRDGQTPTADDVVYTVNHSDFPDDWDTKEYSFNLMQKEGSARFGLLMSFTGGGSSAFQLGHFAVEYSCPNDVEDFIIEEFSETAAKVKWTSAADKWFVFHRVEGETSRNYTELTTAQYEMTGLKPHTTYEIGITKMCEEGDTAKVRIFEVTTSGDVCDKPTDIVAEPKKYEATLTWQGEASAYNVRYRQMGTEEWTAETVSETTATIKNLNDNTEYEYQLQSQCSKLDWDVSEWTDIATFKTIEETLFPPTNIVVSPTHKNAIVAWEGETSQYEIDYRTADSDPTQWTTLTVEGKEALIENLTAKTAYKLRMRSVDADDKSLNSETIDFTTLDTPECVTPTDLTASGLTDHSVVLSWTADENNLTWNLRYRETNASQWTERLELTETNVEITDLKDNTAYLWRVQATCEDNITSKWAAQQRFTTETTGIGSTDISCLAVDVDGNTLSVVNPQHSMIRDIVVYDTAGRLIARYDVNTTDNVFVRMGNVSGNIVIKVNGTKETKTFKTVVKRRDK